MKQIFVLALILVLVFKVNAQLPTEVKILSPNIASLGTFGNIPVSLYTGTPDIQIPIHTVESGDIKLPLVLRYHNANVKPDQHPGWVGLGWDLNCEGVITRSVHYKPDESDVNNLHPFFPQGNPEIFTPDSLMSNRNTWGTLDGCSTDLYADDFYFNFLNYSGRFIWTNKGWKVQCDKNIKILTDDSPENFISKYEIQNSLNNYPPNFQSAVDNEAQSRMFYQFTLVTDDGTRYIFGNDKNAIEYSYSYGSPFNNVTAYAWHLTKIIDPKNNVIELKYERQNAICKLSVAAWSNSMIDCDFNIHLGQNGEIIFPENILNFKFGTINTHFHKGIVYLPVYLTDIVSKNEKLTFSSDFTNELRYSDRVLSYAIDNDSKTEYDPTIYHIRNEDYKWKQLDNIRITNNSGDFQQLIHLKYSSLNNQRLTLNSLDLDALNLKSSPYFFYYNNVEKLPQYGGDSTDHWGYCNNKTINNLELRSLNPSPNSPKETNNTLTSTKNINNLSYPIVATGLLCRITYPTGGYTTFDWEANQYSKVVSTNRSSTYPENGVTGGCRIKEIKSYDNINSVPFDKKYYYVSNYKGNGTTSLSSSGILNGKPLYHVLVDKKTNLNINNNDPKNLEDIEKYTTPWYEKILNVLCFGACLPSGTPVIPNILYYTESYDALSSYSYNANGSQIGYSKVVEQNADSSYSIFSFTNYEKDTNNVDHFDKLGFSAGWDKDQDVYFPASELTNERGKQTAIQQFNANNKLIHYSSFKYDDNPLRFNKYFQTITIGTYLTCNTLNGLFLGSANKVFTYKYNLLSETNTKYDLNGNNPTSSTITYKYNNDDYINSTSQSQSDGSTLTTTYKYPNDYSFQYVGVDCAKDFKIACYADFANWQNQIYNMPNQLGQYYKNDLLDRCVNESYYCLGLEPNPNGTNDPNGDFCRDAYHNLSSSTFNPINTEYNDCLHFTGILNEDGNDNYLVDLQQKNILTPVVEETTTLQKEGKNYLVKSKYYDFDENGSSIKPHIINEYKPVLPTLYDSNTMGTYIIDNYFDVRNFNSYHYSNQMNNDEFGNLIEVLKLNYSGILSYTSYLYGYNHTYPIAEATNARNNEIFSTSYEEDADFGNWVSKKITTDSHSGKNCMLLSPGSFNIAIDFAKSNLKSGKYKYSAWVKTSGTGLTLIIKDFTPNVSGASWIPSSIPNTNGQWQYFEVVADMATGTFPNSTTVRAEIWNNGSTNAYVDDVRFLPVNAKMTTYTYSPLVGMTSSTDTNGYTTYYDFDGLGRLIRTRDFNGNIIKQYDYHYLNQ